jgi:16S rRNA U1498 N3-methylase RsmE
VPELPVTAPRLFIAPSLFAPPAPVLLRGAEHHYLTRVLRLRLGDAVVLLDGGGRLGAARLARVDAEQVELAWEAATTAPASVPFAIAPADGLPATGTRVVESGALVTDAGGDVGSKPDWRRAQSWHS